MKAESRPVANGDADPDDLGDAAVIRLSRVSLSNSRSCFAGTRRRSSATWCAARDWKAADDVAERFLLAFRQLHLSRPVAAEIWPVRGWRRLRRYTRVVGGG